MLSSITQARLEANYIAFNAIFDDFTIANYHKFFKCKVRYGYVHPDNKIELFKCPTDIITDDYRALILFKCNKIYVIRKKFKKYINFNSKEGSMCVKCGMFFLYFNKHLQYCPVVGTKISTGIKVGGDSLTTNLEIKNLLEKLGIEENKNSTEPDLYLRRNVDFGSSAVLRVTNSDQIYRSLFNLFFYNNL